MVSPKEAPTQAQIDLFAKVKKVSALVESMQMSVEEAPPPRKKVKRAKKTVPCGVNECTAMFVSTQDRKAHQIRRHTHLFEYDEETKTMELIRDDEAGGKKKKNRMGQNQRRRVAMLKERAEWDGVSAPSEAYIKRKIRQKRQKKEKEEEVEKKQNEEAFQKMHPSWQAAKKTQVAVVEFAGSKITFGDDSEDEGEQKKEGRKMSGMPKKKKKKKATLTVFDDDSD